MFKGLKVVITAVAALGMSASLAFAASAAEGLSTAPAAPAPATDASALDGELKAVFGDLKAGRYLAAVDRAEMDAHDARLGTGDANPFGQLSQQISPFLEERVDPSSLTQKPGQPDPKDVAAFQGAEPHDAIDEIVSRARNTSIVILNEAHHSPRDRAFALQVAKALRPLGYSVLALEALETKDGQAQVARDGYARMSSGLYTMDPAFADFLRQSLAMGYRPVSYEADDTVGANLSGMASVAAREQAECDNLMNRIFKKQPAAKVLIYVGYEHATEVPMKTKSGPMPWMAARLKAATGVDPLTIDQTTVSELSNDSSARQLYELIAARVGNKPVVFMHDGQPVKVGHLGQGTDLQVVHPRLRYVDGRPTWLLTMGRHPVKVPRNLLPSHGRRLVQAFIAGEPADAVPVDQVVVEAGKPAPVLMLPSKRIRFAVQDDDSNRR